MARKNSKKMTCGKPETPYGYVINNDFRCEQCSAGFDEEDRTEPVNEQPKQGEYCCGCGQYYFGGHEWGTKRELVERCS